MCVCVEGEGGRGCKMCVYGGGGGVSSVQIFIVVRK